MQQILTMTLWELQRIFYCRNRVQRTWLAFVFLVVAAAIQPFILPAEFVKSPLFVLFFAILPCGGIFIWLCDSFAGERERHTLETLLLTPVPDWTIIGGKIIALSIYTGMLVGGVLFTLIIGQTIIIGDYPDMMWYSFIFFVTLLSYIFIINVGMMVTWSAPSLQIAQQILLYPFVGLGLGVPLVVSWLPVSLREPLMDFFLALNRYSSNSIVFTITLIAALGSLVVVLVRFRRERLLLL
ncbi:MAG: hypothetical protein GFH27_549379n62 [Chloroflexi bacterium AL-W]|nr:hypothetical protein [Chloroflexi bacterium AL-N1]NOK71186.1 hypothetical protein [Chloroflexi bacterium AL-N10]NOK78652.1 hypothetical protein [Chloroflexi bacterium AL-N5]NOK85948.1 hypothetical protein [Chloroflexi bacterium AL-W]NOK92923.1 hypothetical protein [Chloroflexi bacterium AL-N15]